MSATKVRLWIIRETENARLYGKSSLEGQCDSIWIPKSIIEHTTKRGREHVVSLPDWFVEKEGL